VSNAAAMRITWTFRTAATATAIAMLANGSASAAPAGYAPPRNVAPFVRFAQRSIAITDVRVIDGTGAAPRDHQTVLIQDDRIAAAGDARTIALPPATTTIDGRGRTLIPGLVGTHEHLFWTAPNAPGPYLRSMPFSFPRLYLAAGVTTARTTGSVAPWTDLAIAEGIAARARLGPKLDPTAPYIGGPGEFYANMARLRTAAEAREFVATWAQRGFTSFKLYMHVTPEVARAAVDEAHRHDAKVAAHLCSLGVEEAIAIGVDSIEHGLFADEDIDPAHRGETCPDANTELTAALASLRPGDPRVAALIRDLIARHVALSSTLALFESVDARRQARDGWPRTAAMLNPGERAAADQARARLAEDPPGAAQADDALLHEMRFEAAFYRAGGLLTAGADPTGMGTVIAGLGDQREFELLVEAGLRVPEAVRVMTLNGAVSLGRSDRVGTIAPGKDADLILLDGDLTANPAAIETPLIVFQDGIGYDPAAIFASLRGTVGGG
jgi:imidazolonepropionase-like amidohydrolase